jgi:hypothetical protein
MSGASKVRATKVRQQQPAKRTSKPGRPFNGPNLVAQHDGSTKKAARKASGSRRAN